MVRAGSLSDGLEVERLRFDMVCATPSRVHDLGVAPTAPLGWHGGAPGRLQQLGV